MYVCMYACLRCTWQPAPVEVLLSLSHVLVVSYCQLARPHPIVFVDAVGQLHLAARVRLVHLPRSFRACAQSSARSVAGSSWELRAGLPRPKDLEDKLAGSRMSMSMLEGYLHSFTACCDSARLDCLVAGSGKGLVLSVATPGQGGSTRKRGLVLDFLLRGVVSNTRSRSRPRERAATRVRYSTPGGSGKRTELVDQV